MMEIFKVKDYKETCNLAAFLLVFQQDKSVLTFFDIDINFK